MYICYSVISKYNGLALFFLFHQLLILLENCKKKKEYGKVLMSYFPVNILTFNEFFFLLMFKSEKTPKTPSTIINFFIIIKCMSPLNHLLEKYFA